MKLLLTIVLTFIFSITSKAQLDKSTWLFTGTGNFSSTNYDFKNTLQNTTQKSTSINIKLSPAVSFFIIDKFAIGLRTSISFEKSDGGDVYDSSGNIVASGGSSKITRFDIGPVLRYYFFEKEKTINFFGELGYQYGIDRGLSFDVHRNTFFINGGMEIFFNSSVGLEFTLGYLTKKEDNSTISSQKQNSIQAGIGFNFHLQK